MLEIIGAKGSLILGGLFGTLIGTTLQKDIGLWQRVISVLTGTVFAVYVTPVIHAWLVPNSEVMNGLSFLVGMFGLNIARKIMEAKAITFGKTKIE